ncbi:MAG: GerMN domain-containing protein [Anaerolineae bacterium]|nr:GerMN domain-containing protein [Anaerolineae bacterium]
MKHCIQLGSIILLIAAMLSCNAPRAPTVTPFPTVTMTNPPTAESSATFSPSAATSTSETAPSASATRPSTILEPTAVSTPAGIDQIKIFLVAVEDNGQSGDKIGCGDSIVAVERQITPTQAPLRTALEELLAIRDQYLGESGLYNALYQSMLTIGDIAIDEDGKAVIHLEGTLLSGGTCDDPRIIAQLIYTATQFSTVNGAEIYINGTLIQELLSGE